MNRNDFFVRHADDVSPYNIIRNTEKHGMHVFLLGDDRIRITARAAKIGRVPLVYITRTETTLFKFRVERLPREKQTEVKNRFLEKFFKSTEAKTMIYLERAKNDLGRLRSPNPSRVFIIAERKIKSQEYEMKKLQEKFERRTLATLTELISEMEKLEFSFLNLIETLRDCPASMFVNSQINVAPNQPSTSR